MEGSTALTEFPDRLSPVFVRDLRQGLRANYFVWIFIVLQLLSLIATLVELAVLQVIGSAAQGPFLSGFFTFILSVTFGFVLPTSLFGSLQSELGQGRNIELLLTSSLTRWQLVRGKLLVACCLSGLLLGSLLPYFLIRYFLGSLELVPGLAIVAMILLINATMSAIVIGASGYTNYVGRCIVILFLSAFPISLLLNATSTVLTGNATGWTSFLQISIALIAALLFIGFGLQLGRAKVRLFEKPIDPPSAAVIFVLAFFTPIMVGVATFYRSSTAALVILLCLLWLVFSIDRGGSRKKRLKGLQP